MVVRRVDDRNTVVVVVDTVVTVAAAESIHVLPAAVAREGRVSHRIVKVRDSDFPCP